MHDVVRLLTGSASDWIEDYFEHEAVQGYHASSSIIGSKVGPMSPGSGLVLLFHKMGEHDGDLGSWAFHKGGNGGFTQVLARAAEAYGAEIRLGAQVSSRAHRGGPRPGVVLEDGTELRAPVVVSALDPRRTFLDLVDPRELPADLVDNVERMRFRGVSGEGQLRPRRAAGLPRPAGHGRPLRRVPQHRPDDRVRRAGLRRREVRLVQRAAVHRRRDPVGRRPRHGTPGQARDVVLRAVRALRAARQRLGDRAGELRRQGAGRPRVALPRLRRPGAAPRGGHPRRHRAAHRAHRGQHLRGRVPRPADVLLPARAGLEPVPHPHRRLLPVRLRAPTPAAASSGHRGSSPASGCCAT